ncbi:hypothetical protein B0H15DRAFT_945321 [Mycena belliarum]|uniref:F-box domain-containing protein n=1 Tax=Mycena belliarum TaxID=1033014 RepID=A0AAD6XRZ1_9AGAR|nr:hypothetical protein B0H15DRAFT_945321 [Mycena belliae]
MPPLTRLAARDFKHRTTVMRDAVLANDDLLLACLRYLNFVDLMAFSYTSSEFASVVKRMLKGRVRRYTLPFFGSLDSLRLFFSVLEGTCSWVVGSTALAVVSVRSDVPGPNNLNIITSARQVPEWVKFLVDVCHFDEGQRIMCRGAYAHVGAMYLVFVHRDREARTVTITTSASSSLSLLFLAAPNTNQQIAVSASHIITPYVELMAEQKALKGWRPSNYAAVYVHHLPGHGTYHDTTPFPGAVTLLASAAHRRRPCGWACPAIHRNARGLVGIGHWKWGGMDGQVSDTDPVLLEMARSDVTFHLGRACSNDMCPNSHYA